MENILFFFANLPVYSYGFMLGLGLFFGSILAQREGKRKGFGGELIFEFIVRVGLIFVLFGRIGFVFSIYNWRFMLYPWVLFSGFQLNETWGLMASVFYSIYYLIRHVDQPAAFLDVFTPTMALMQSLAYLGSSVLGRETTSALGVNLGGLFLHPLPLYGALLYYLLFSFLWRMRRNLRYDGQLLLGYLALSALIQRILMPFREVFGESTNPWLYTLAAFFFGFAWFWVFIQSPLTDIRRRRPFNTWQAWTFYILSQLVVGLCMVKFFYWRFG